MEIMGEREIILLALSNQINLYAFSLENDPNLQGEDRKMAETILDYTMVIESKYRKEYIDNIDVPLKRPSWDELKR